MQLAFFQSTIQFNSGLRAVGTNPAVRSKFKRKSMRLCSLRPTIWLLTTLALLLGGCTSVPRLSVNVDAINSGQPVQEVRYVLQPVVKGVDKTDLHFIEYSRHIDRALQKRGMTKAQSAEQANVAIEVNYGYKRYQRALRRDSIFDDPFYHERRCRRWHKGRCLHWYPYSRFDRWYDRPSHHVDVITNYRVFVVLEAKRLDAASDEPALWTTRARARFAKPDLRVTLPLLLMAAEEYIGVDTGHERTVVLTGDDLSLEVPQGDVRQGETPEQ